MKLTRSIRDRRGVDVIVVKLGGAALKATLADPKLFKAFAAIPNLVVVHGGGPAISKVSSALNLESKFVDGQRVTTAEHLEVVEMVLSGQINPALVRGFCAAGAKAFGLSGVDGSLFECVEENPMLGLVGRVSQVNLKALETVRAAGFLPVVAPVGVFAKDTSFAGQAANVNADLAAAKLAAALKAERVLFLTDRDGILDSEGGVISNLSAEKLKDLASTPTIHAGMKVKARAILEFLAECPKSSVAVMNGIDVASLDRALRGDAGTRVQS